MAKRPTKASMKHAFEAALASGLVPVASELTADGIFRLEFLNSSSFKPSTDSAAHEAPAGPRKFGEPKT